MLFPAYQKIQIIDYLKIVLYYHDEKIEGIYSFFNESVL